LLDFIREYRILIIATIIVAFTGWLLPIVSYILVPLIFILFIAKGHHKEVLLFFYVILVFSDNPDMFFAKKIKPLLILIFTLFTVKNSNLWAGNKVFKSFAIFFSYTILLLLLSPNTLVAFQKNLSYILLFLTIPGYVTYLIDREGPKILLDMVNFSILILLIGIVLIPIFPNMVYSHGGRLHGLLGNPNGLAMMCFFNFILFQLFKDTFSEMNILSRINNITIIIVIIFTLYLTGSRTSWISVLIFLFFRQFSGISPTISLVIMLFVVLVYDYVFIIGLTIVDQLGLNNQLRIADGAESVENASGRTVAWRFAWEEIQKNMFFGRGWAYDEYWIFGPIQKTLNVLNHQGGVHNVYLILWLNTGAVGLLLYLFSLTQLFFNAAKNSGLALPILFACLFVANFEPWLAASLNPFTIQFIICIAVILHIPEINYEDQNHVEIVKV